LWNAWQYHGDANQYLSHDADGNLIPKPNRRDDPEVLRALESWKAHNKNIAELQKKIAEIKAKILSM
jgi:hypothetical protein